MAKRNYLEWSSKSQCSSLLRMKGRVIVSIGREDNVTFVGLCDARGIPVLRIGVTDQSSQLEIQDLATWNLSDLKNAHSSTIPELFG